MIQGVSFLIESTEPRDSKSSPTRSAEGTATCGDSAVEGLNPLFHQGFFILIQKPFTTPDPVRNTNS